MAYIVRKNIGKCEAPTDPPPAIIYSCIYEYMCILDCSNSCNITPDDSILTDIEGMVITRSRGLMNDGTINLQKFGFFGSVGVPETVPWLCGLVTEEEWKKIRIDGDGTKIGAWNWSPWHNRLAKPNRWLLAKYYHEETHFKFEFDPAKWQNEGIKVPITFECPQDPEKEFSPPRPGRQWWEDNGAKCPNYYTLSACADCHGEKSALPDHYSESTDEINVGAGVINSKKDQQTIPPVYDCYDVTKSACGFREDKHICTVTTPGIANGKFYQAGTKYYCESLNIVDLSGGDAAGKYRIEKNCQSCKSPILWVVSDVPNCEGTPCDAVDVAAAAGLPLGQDILACVAAQNVLYGNSPKTAGNLDWIKDNLADKSGVNPVTGQPILNYIWWKGSNGRCAKFALIDPTCPHKDVLGRCLSNTQNDLGSYINPSVNDVCECAKTPNPVLVGSKTSAGNAWRLCNPMHDVLKIIKHPGSEMVNERDSAQFSCWALSPPTPDWKWYIRFANNKVLRLTDGSRYYGYDSVNFGGGGSAVKQWATISIQSQGGFGIPLIPQNFKSYLKIDNVPYSWDGAKVWAVVDNQQGKTVKSNEGLLSVNEDCAVIMPCDTEVTLVKVILYCPQLHQAYDGTMRVRDLRKVAGPIWRWAKGNYKKKGINPFSGLSMSGRSGDFFLLPMHKAARTNCAGPALGCPTYPNIAGIEVAGQGVLCAGPNNTMDCIKHTIVGKIVDYEGPMTWCDAKDKYDWMRGIGGYKQPGGSVDTGCSETNKYEIALGHPEIDFYESIGKFPSQTNCGS